eukprot:359240-Chlamydomonas_euryale.AAC.12
MFIILLVATWSNETGGKRWGVGPTWPLGVVWTGHVHSGINKRFIRLTLSSADWRLPRQQPNNQRRTLSLCTRPLRGCAHVCARCALERKCWCGVNDPHACQLLRNRPPGLFLLRRAASGAKALSSRPTISRA